MNKRRISPVTAPVPLTVVLVGYNEPERLIEFVDGAGGTPLLPELTQTKTGADWQLPFCVTIIYVPEATLFVPPEQPLVKKAKLPVVG